MKSVDTKHQNIEALKKEMAALKKAVKNMKAVEKASEFCKKWIQAPVHILSNGAICVKGDVDLTGVPRLIGTEITELPVQFAVVTGNFNCASWDWESSDPDSPLLNLTTLKGCPLLVGGSFICESNPIASLEGGPLYVLGSYDCQFTQITSFKGAPEFVGGNFMVPTDELVDEYVSGWIKNTTGGLIESPFGVKRESVREHFKDVGKRRELGQADKAEWWHDFLTSLINYVDNQPSDVNETEPIRI